MRRFTSLLIPGSTVLLVAALGSAAGDGRAEAGRAAPARGMPIVYVTGDGQGNGLVVVRPDGSGRRRLKAGAGFHVNPRWSPDGSRLAFTNESQTCRTDSPIVVADADGSHRHSIVGEGEQPRWSPGGAWIAFQVQLVHGSTGCPDDEAIDLWVVRPDGSHPRRLTDTRSAVGPEQSRHSIYAGHAWSWSPRGGMLAVEWPSGPGLHDPLEILVIDVRSGARRVLTTGCQPVWSPDGRRIAFVEQTPETGSTGGIAVIGVDGRGSHELVPSRRGIDYAPSWSPDGRRIAFNRQSGGTSLEVVGADGVGLRSLGKVREEGLTRPQWSRDGRTILWSSELGGNFLALVTATGRSMPVAPIPGVRWAQDADWRG